MNVFIEYIIGNVVVFVCIFYKKYVKNKKKWKKKNKIVKLIL